MDLVDLLRESNEMNRFLLALLQKHWTEETPLTLEEIKGFERYDRFVKLMEIYSDV